MSKKAGRASRKGGLRRSKRAGLRRSKKAGLRRGGLSRRVKRGGFGWGNIKHAAGETWKHASKWDDEGMNDAIKATGDAMGANSHLGERHHHSDDVSWHRDAGWNKMTKGQQQIMEKISGGRL